MLKGREIYSAMLLSHMAEKRVPIFGTILTSAPFLYFYNGPNIGPYLTNYTKMNIFNNFKNSNREIGFLKNFFTKNKFCFCLWCRLCRSNFFASKSSEHRPFNKKPLKIHKKLVILKKKWCIIKFGYSILFFGFMINEKRYFLYLIHVLKK